MLAARWHRRGDIRVEDIELREPRDDEVVVRIHYCGVCGTDLEEFRSGPLTIPTEPHPQSGRMAPLTLGHEVVGEIARAAADGSGPPVGTLVVPDVVNGCGNCWWCRRHLDGLCPSVSVPGQQDDGGLAQYMIARARTCVVLPDGMTTRTAVLAEPAAVAVRAVAKLRDPVGSTLVVIGGGTIGQLTAQVAVAAGVRTCILVDPSPFRRDVAQTFANVSACSPEELDDLVAGLPEPGVDVVIEASGAAGQLRRSLEVVRAGGTVVAVGLRSEDEPISVADLVLGERLLIGSAAHRWDTDVATAISMLSDGRIRSDGLITHEFGLTDLTDRVLPLLADGGAATLKVVVDCRLALTAPPR